jgi:hypothetical protein
MVNLLMNDPAAIAFVSDIRRLRFFDAHMDAYKAAVRADVNATDAAFRIATQIAQEVKLNPSSETVLGIAFLFTCHVAEMLTLTEDTLN